MALERKKRGGDGWPWMAGVHIRAEYPRGTSGLAETLWLLNHNAVMLCYELNRAPYKKPCQHTDHHAEVAPHTGQMVRRLANSAPRNFSPVEPCTTLSPRTPPPPQRKKNMYLAIWPRKVPGWEAAARNLISCHTTTLGSLLHLDIGNFVQATLHPETLES